MTSANDGVPRDVALDVLDDGGGAEFIPLLLTLPCLLLGPVLLAVGLRRAGLADWWPLAAWVLGIGVFLVSEFTVKVGEVTGIASAAVAPALIGWSASRPARASEVAQRGAVTPRRWRPADGGARCVIRTATCRCAFV